MAYSPESPIIQTEDGFKVRETEEYVIEVHEMLFNWRIVIMRPNQKITIDHAYCYYGTGLETLARAIAAAVAWEDPYNTKPEGFDKQAF